MKRIFDRIKNGIIVWGRGNESKKFLEGWEKFKKLYCNNCGHDLDLITCYWDSNYKQHKADQNMLTQRPFSISPNSAYCVIAIADYKTIEKELLEHGWSEDYYSYWQRFLLEIRSEIVKECVENKEAIVNNRFDKKMYALCEVNRWLNDGYEISKYEQLKTNFTLEQIISSIADICGYDIEDVLSFFEERKRNLRRVEYRKIKTIGIYDERFHNGGGQRFLSIIIPIYLSCGYKVVLFTDEYVPDKEYKIPSNVVRVVLQNSYLYDFENRLKEFHEAIKINHVDIMCYHNRVESEEFFYEMLYFHQIGIPVLAELHLMFIMTLRNGKYLQSYLPRIFSLADKIIVLSRINEKFWKMMGCKAKYIPNPVDDVNNVWPKEIALAKRNGKNIIWIGRVTPNGKRIFDAIKIMEVIHKTVPEAKLQIIGEINSLHVKNKLNELINEYNLEDVVELCGYQNDVYSFYENADCMLMTSEMEGFPLVLIESKLYGVPTIMYELPYLELIQDGKGVIQVNQKNIDEAASAVIKLLMDDELRIKMSKEAKESLEYFIKYDIAGAWVKVYDEIASGVNDEKKEDQQYAYIINLFLHEINEKKF